MDSGLHLKHLFSQLDLLLVNNGLGLHLIHLFSQREQTLVFATRITPSTHELAS